MEGHNVRNIVKLGAKLPAQGRQVRVGVNDFPHSHLVPRLKN
jgi:hypothetical protein